MLSYQNIAVCEISDTYLVMCLGYGEKHGKDILISCGRVLLFTNIKFGLNMLIMGLAFRQSLMVVSILLYA